MSWRASEWAKKTRGHKNGSQKKVLMILAAEYNEKWGYAWISYTVLARSGDNPACGGPKES